MNEKNLIFEKVRALGEQNGFIEDMRRIWINDPDEVSKIYTRDKETSDYKVVSLKSGGYALVDGNKNIIFKNEDLHLCKVEWIMLVHCNI